MSRKQQFVALVIAYTIIIVGAMYWSGTIVQQTIYDRYIVSLEGSLVRVSDTERAKQFYSEVLDFSSFKLTSQSKQQIFGFRLPDNRKIFLEQGSMNPSFTPALLVIRVRNGFAKLHKALVERSKQPAQVLDATSHLDKIEFSRISTIVEQPWGQEFIAADPDGNRLIYFQPKQRKGSRQ